MVLRQKRKPTTASVPSLASELSDQDEDDDLEREETEQEEDGDDEELEAAVYDDPEIRKSVEVGSYRDEQIRRFRRQGRRCRLN